MASTSSTNVRKNPPTSSSNDVRKNPPTSSSNDVRKDPPASNTNDSTYIWSDEETRLYLQLRLEERDKGNAKKAGINDTRKKNIMDKFSEVYGSKHRWGKFRNKYNTCKKQYSTFKRLTHMSGLGYFSNGAIDMTDDWWEDRIKEWPGAKKFREKSVANMDLMEKLYGSVHISGGEGWSAQQGEEQLDAMMLDEDINESDAPPPASFAAEDDVPSTTNVPSTSKSKASKKRRVIVDVADAIRDAISGSTQSRDQFLARKNQILEQHLDHLAQKEKQEQHLDLSCSQPLAMDVLHSLGSVRMWSPLYKAAILHLQANHIHRQTLLAYKEEENQVLYLEFATGESRYA